MKRRYTDVWRKIKGYGDRYRISDTGKIVSNYSGIPVILQRAVIGKNGYYHIELYNNGIRKNFLVHRLVAKVFVPNPKNKPQVNHKDGNKINNCKSNLEWATSSENMRHAYPKLLEGIQNRTKKNKFIRGAYYRRGKYESNLRIDGTLHYLGAFDNESYAHEIYYIHFVWHYGYEPFNYGVN